MEYDFRISGQADHEFLSWLPAQALKILLRQIARIWELSCHWMTGDSRYFDVHGSTLFICLDRRESKRRFLGISVRCSSDHGWIASKR